MKKTSKLYQTVSVITLCFLMLSFLFGCSMLNVEMDNLNFENQDAETDKKNNSIENKDDVNNDQNVKDDDKNTEEKNDESLHVHEFKSEFDETSHFSKCECGEITDRISHTLDWVIDQEPTYTAPGYKHQECDCGFISSNKITIDKIVASIDPSLGTYINFNTQADVIHFFEENKSKLNGSFLCFDASSDFENGLINLDNLLYKSIYTFDYELIDSEEHYINSRIIVAFGLYAEEFEGELSKDDVNNDIHFGGAAATLTFYMEFYEFEEKDAGYEFEFKKYNNPNSSMKYVINIYYDSKCIGNVYYYYNEEKYTISQDWIINYIESNLLMI